MNDMKINYERLEEAIAGDHDALSTAFTWNKTTQGHSFWRDQFRGITPLDIDVLKAMRKKPDTPTLWRDMTDAEKGALLLAKHENKDIEDYTLSNEWVPMNGLRFYDTLAYRIKPEPKRETVTMYASKRMKGFSLTRGLNPDVSITFTKTDGEPDTASIKMEKL